jgi:outer membrane receptor protein involved in Fe transport
LFGDVLYNQVEGKENQAPQPIGASSLVETFTGAPYVPADHPGNPFGTDGELRSRLLDIGNRREVNKATAYRAVLGLEGLWDDWDWQLSGLASKSKVNKHYLNEVLIDHYQLALLGAGGPNGNQWYDPFGANPQNDPSILDWLTTDASSRDSSKEYSTDLLFRRMFGAFPGGPVGFAIGLQYRKQELDQWADENLLNGALHVTHEPVSADRDIASAYFEFKLPLLDSLEAQLALRYEHYSDFGSTTNPKIALRWQPLPSLMFRGSWSTSFKPPSFYELYIPLQRSVSQYRDTVRCEITGLPEDCTSREYRSEGGGNPNLDPETGESWFAGMVWTPEFLPGFEFQLDFWKFRHEDRIEWLSGQTVLDEGGDLGIIREPPEPDGTPGQIILVQETFFNIDALLTRGFDTTMRYSWQTDRAGNFRASLMHTYIDQWKIVESASGNFLLNKNVAGHWWGVAVPRNRANVNISWDMGQHAAAANIHYIGHWYNLDNLWVDGEPTDQPMIIPSHTTLDLQYSYTFERLRNAIVRFGCNNVTDKDPPLIYWPTNEPLHDGRGRFFYLRWQQPIHP